MKKKMNKALVNCDVDVVNLLLKISDDDFVWVESELGIEFPFVDGKFQSDEDCDETQNVDTDSYRINEPGFLPETYPCVVVYKYEKTFDRVGKVAISLYEFVYLTDFIKP